MSAGMPGATARHMMRPSPAMDPAGMTHDSRLLSAYVDTLKLARKVDVRQGNTEPVTATVQFTTGAAGLIAAGVQRTGFLDNLNDAAASGLVQTPADSNLFGGKVPSGEMIILRGLGFSVYSEGDFTAQDVTILSRNLSVLMLLRRTPVNMGAVWDWPDILGARGTGIGNQQNGTVPFTPPLVLEPLQDFTMTLQTVRAFNLSLADADYFVHIRLPSLRIYDPIVLGKS